MTDLTHTQLTEIADNINKAIEDWSVKTLAGEPRTHLGISEIGEDCKRKLWYKFRWAAFEQFDGRMLRLFKRGHREEERFINYLEGIGCTVKRFDDSGKQFRVSGVMGHYGGSCDGVVITPWYSEPFLLEMKTHNTKSFVHYLDKGLRLSKPKHFAQMSGYGEKMQIKYGLYFPENKNDDHIRVTAIKLDWELGKSLERKAEEIVTASEPLARISDNSAYFECKYCFAKDVCHNGAIPVRNCRSCKNVKATENTSWTCSKFGIIPNEFIAKGCQEWMPV
jgi:hypothetical protein